MDAEDIIQTIVDETELDEEEVKDKVKNKIEEFEGLVSEEGAIHLVAKEHGVQVSEDNNQDLKIENIVPDMRKVHMKARVVRVLEPNTFERDDGDEGKVQNVVLGDDTGTIRLTLWDDQTEIAEKIGEGDAIELAGAYTIEDNRENAELRLGDSAQVKMADDDEVPEVETGGGGSETSEVSIREVRNENTSYQVQGMLMAVYTSNPFYNICPECGTSVREDDDGKYVCKEHGEVEPDKALAVSAVLDDGTGNLRVVFFRDQARELLDIDEDIEKEGEIEEVEKAAEDVLGTELSVEGRTRYNDYFGRIEMIANEIEEVVPEEQIEDMLELMEV
ncbi:MAG: hypothetical protein ABEJ75_01350 [Candidatus Nanohaloarchaea archaeon]